MKERSFVSTANCASVVSMTQTQKRCTWKVGDTACSTRSVDAYICQSSGSGSVILKNRSQGDHSCTLTRCSIINVLQKKVNPDLQVEVKPSIRARKIQEEKMRKQMQKEEYWRRREEEERWRMEMRCDHDELQIPAKRNTNVFSNLVWCHFQALWREHVLEASWRRAAPLGWSTAFTRWRVSTGASRSPRSAARDARPPATGPHGMNSCFQTPHPGYRCV